MCEIGQQGKDRFCGTIDEDAKVQVGHTFSLSDLLQADGAESSFFLNSTRKLCALKRGASNGQDYFIRLDLLPDREPKV